MRLRRYLPLMLGTFALAGVALLSITVSCGDDKPPVNPDSRRPDVGVDAPTPDQPRYPDLPQWDKAQWPDYPPKDTRAWYDQYVGSTFGCQADSDCFGQKCCPTPWGVKLCSPSCDLK